MDTIAEQIAAERARLLKILAIEKPNLKPGSRNRAWKAQRERAMDVLRKLDRGEWPVEDDAAVPL